MSCQGWVNTAIATSALTNRLTTPLPFGGEAIDGVELTGDILVFGCCIPAEWSGGITLATIGGTKVT